MFYLLPNLIKFGNYSAPTGRIITAWGNAPGTVIQVKRAQPWALIAPTGRIIIAWGNAPGTVIQVKRALALGFNKAPFQGWVITKFLHEVAIRYSRYAKLVRVLII